jgi:hypothetical protein
MKMHLPGLRYVFGNLFGFGGGAGGFGLEAELAHLQARL